MPVDQELLAETDAFAEDVRDLLDATVSPDPELIADAVGQRVVVASHDLSGDVGVPLTIDGQHRLDLRLLFRCTWDTAERCLAIQESKADIAVTDVREPAVRFHYVRNRSHAPAHIHVHAERGAISAVRALAGTPLPAKLHDLHLPVGGKRFRPCLEDVVEFLVTEWQVDPQEGWQGRVAEGRRRWNSIQLAAALRDYARAHGPSGRASVDRMIDEAFGER